MPSTKSTSRQSIRRSTSVRRSQSTTPLPHPTSAELQHTAAQTTDDWLFANRTKSNYDGHINRGKAFLGSMGDDFANAFDSITADTPVALRMFLSYKCDHEQCSFKTAEGIRSAFKTYFRDILQCQGEFWEELSDGRFRGNPVYEQSFMNYYKSLSKRDGRIGESTQSLPMLYPDMVKFMYYVESSESSDLSSEERNLIRVFAATGFTLWTR